jgi:ABC-type glutathione transport system ATPase component
MIADDVLVMAAGRVVEAGPASDVFDDPQTELTRALIAAVPGTRTPTHPRTTHPRTTHTTNGA